MGLSMNAFALDIGETAVDISIDAAFMSKYVWRGILLTDGPVFQPGITAGYKSLSFNIWSNMDLDDVNDNKNEINELDFTLDYSFDVSSFSISAGIIRYTFPNTDFDPTTELYAGLSSDYTKDASLTIYQDVGEAEGTYISLGYDCSIPVAKVTSIDIGGAVGFGTAKHNEFYYGEDNASLTDLFIGVSTPVEIGEFFLVTPGISFSSILNSDISDTFDDAGIDPNNLVFGVTFSSAF